MLLREKKRRTSIGLFSFGAGKDVKVFRVRKIFLDSKTLI